MRKLRKEDRAVGGIEFEPLDECTVNLEGWSAESSGDERYYKEENREHGC